MKVLVIAEHDNHVLKAATTHVISAAQSLVNRCTVAVVGHECDAVNQQVAKLSHVETVISLQDARFASPVAEDVCDAVLGIAKSYDAILAPATTFGKNMMPRLAAKLDVALHSDVINVVEADTYDRPIYAGNVIQRVKALDNQKLLTIRPTAFEPASASDDNDASIENVSPELCDVRSQFVSKEETQSERPELTEARVVVSGGRALQSEENFKLIETLADCLKGAVGASRAAVDAGYIPNDHQVGQTGKVVAPALYIAVGISGAIQHLAGMKDSKVIVAINKDEDAPIFQIATYGLVGDLFEIVPELIEKLKE